MKFLMAFNLSIILLIFNIPVALADSACGGTAKEPCACNQRIDSATHQCYVDNNQCSTKCTNKPSKSTKPVAKPESKKKKNLYN